MKTTTMPTEGTPADVIAGRAQYAIICGDSLKVCRELHLSCKTGDRKPFDLSLTSPPYEDRRTYGIGFKLRGEDWVRWACERFTAQYRATRGLTAWVVEGFTTKYQWSATPALMMADLHRTGVKLRKPPAFCRIGIPGSGGPDFWRNDYEFIVCGSHGKLPWSDNVACGHTPKYAPGGEMSNRMTDGRRVNQWGASLGSTGREMTKEGRRNSGTPKPSHVVVSNRDPFGLTNGGGRGRAKDGEPQATRTIKRTAVTRGSKNGDVVTDPQGYEPPTKANPGNLVKCVVGGGVMGSKLAHENEAPYPLSLAERFVRSFCPPNGIVFDGFSGSGTTLHAALLHGRRVIAVDVRESQCDVMRRRAAEAIAQLQKQAADAA